MNSNGGLGARAFPPGPQIQSRSVMFPGCCQRTGCASAPAQGKTENARVMIVSNLVRMHYLFERFGRNSLSMFQPRSPPMVRPKFTAASPEVFALRGCQMREINAE